MGSFRLCLRLHGSFHDSHADVVVDAKSHPVIGTSEAHQHHLTSDFGIIREI